MLQDIESIIGDKDKEIEDLRDQKRAITTDYEQ